MAEKTCFVIMGFGIKTDLKTGREIDLDKTYKNIIKPVFTELGYICFRADEIKHAGIIDIPMYENIIKADFVVADISTLNPNAIYELGVRHAVKNRTTLIIAENGLINPFDLSHIVIRRYEHLGKEIGFDEVMRFRQLLKDSVIELQNSTAPDSPLYSLFPDFAGPSFTKKEIVEIKAALAEETSLSDILKEVEEEKDNKNFTQAIELLEGLKKQYPNNEFIIQRLALCTYKNQLPTPKAALEKAKEILAPLRPDVTTDPETLGLSGAISKRLYEITKDPQDLYKSMWSYERGFYIKQDYYNGINAAFLYSLSASVETDRLKAQASFAQSNSIRHHVIRICNELIADNAKFKQRDDQQWIYFTMAEAHLGIGDEVKEKEYFALGKNIASQFDLDAYTTQNKKLVEIITAFKQKYGVIELD